MLNDRNGKIRYQEAGKWFIHLSNLRRTTVAFVFVATGASIGWLGPQLFSSAASTQPTAFAIFNLLLVVAGMLQEQRLHNYHHSVADYLRNEEKESGPYMQALHDIKVPSTHVVIQSVFSLLALGWVVVLLIHICKPTS